MSLIGTLAKLGDQARQTAEALGGIRANGGGRARTLDEVLDEAFRGQALPKAAEHIKQIARRAQK